MSDPLIIQVRGTSGSGKSTVMKRVMDSLDLVPEYEEKRKRPLFYSQGLRLAVLGHYESPCGGCDTIGSARAVYDLIQRLTHRIIICEGLLLSEDVKWSSQLKNLRIIYLTTPVERCLAQIRSRREEAGNDKPLNEDNTRRRVAVIERSRVKLIDLGVRCIRASANQAPNIIRKWIGD